MLTSAELALMSTVFGFLGIVAGAWVTSIGTRRQQRFEAFQQRYDRRVEVYENLVVSMSDSVLNLERRLAGEEPPERDELTHKAEAILHARAALLSSGEVWSAYGEWTKLYANRAVTGSLSEDERHAARLNYLSEMAAASSRVTQAMAADLEKLSTLSPPRRRPW